MPIGVSYDPDAGLVQEKTTSSPSVVFSGVEIEANIKGAVATTVNSVADVETIDTTGLTDGAVVFSNDIKDFWQLKKSPPPWFVEYGENTVDGITVLTSSAGHTWLRTGISNISWSYQDYWYIDPVSGSDYNVGNSTAFPLKSWAEFRRRVKRAGLKSSTYVTLMNDMPVSDRITIDFDTGPLNALLVLGTPTTIITGTIDSTHRQQTGKLLWLNNDTSSGVPVGYKQMSRTASGGAQTVITSTLGAGTSDLIAKFMTPAGQPGATLAPEGMWALRLFAGATAPVDVFAKIYKCDSSGSDLSLLTTAFCSKQIYTQGGYELSGSSTNTPISNTDRFVIEISGSNASGSPITLYTFFGGKEYNSNLRTASSPTQLSSSIDWSPYINGGEYRIKFADRGAVCYPTVTSSTGMLYTTQPAVMDITSPYYGLPQTDSETHFSIEKCTKVSSVFYNPFGNAAVRFYNIDFVRQPGASLSFLANKNPSRFYGCSIRNAANLGFNSNTYFISSFISTNSPLVSDGPSGRVYFYGAYNYFAGGGTRNAKLWMDPTGVHFGSNMYVANNFLLHESNFRLVNTNAIISDMGAVTYSSLVTNSSPLLVFSNSNVLFQLASNVWGNGFGNYVISVYVDGRISVYDWLNTCNFSVWARANDVRFQGVLINKDFNNLPFWDTTTQSGALQGQ